MAELGLYFRAKQAQLQMVADRGYEVSAEEIALFGMNREQMLALYKGERQTFDPISMNMLYGRAEPNGETTKLLVYYFPGESAKITNENVNPLMAEILRQVPREVLVIASKVGAPTEKILYAAANTRITLIPLIDLAITPLHTFGPSYHKMSPEEQEEYEQDKKQIATPIFSYMDREHKSRNPNHQFLDPVVRYYGWGINDVIEITRTVFYRPTMYQEEISYRTVRPNT